MNRAERSNTVVPRGSRILAVIVAALATASLISSAWTNLESTLGLVPAHALVLWFAWAVLWHPHVQIDDAQVVFVNILRTHQISLAAVEDLNTRWGLVVTANGKRYQAWAAPAPGTLHTMRVNVKNFTRLPDSSLEQGTARLSDDPATDSGAAALHIREGMDAHKGSAQGAAVHTRWHLLTIAIGAGCLIGIALVLL